MRFVFLFLCCLVFVHIGCSHTGNGSRSSDAEMGKVPIAKTITIAAKKGRTYGVIRLAADSKSSILAKLPVGTEMKSFGQVDDWYQVQIPETGQLGWLKSIFIEEDP